MSTLKNNLKVSLKSGRTTYGLWNCLVNSYVAEICAGAGYDWMIVDAEHGHFELNDILSQLQATSAYDISTGVRVTDHNPGMIKRVLDLGAQSIVVPMIDTFEQAMEAQKAILYSPEGVRGAAPSASRAARFGNIANYINSAAEDLCLILQIESQAGINSIDRICELEHVDVLFIGPTDLATSLGFKGDFTHPEVEKVILKSLERIRKNGKSAGILALDPILSRKYESYGANMIGIGLDILLLKNSFEQNLKDHR